MANSGEMVAGIKPSWKSLFSFTARRHLSTLVAGSIFALFAGCVTPALAIFLGNIFDCFIDFGAGDIQADRLRSKVGTNCLGMVGLGTAGWFLNGVYFATFVAFGELQASRVRSSIFKKLLKRDMEWFQAQKEGSGALLSKIQAHINELQTATSQPLGLLLQYSCRSLASLVLAFYTSWSLSLVTLAGIPIFTMIIALLSARMKPNIEKQQEKLTQASKIANNAITFIDTVKCLNGQKLESRSFSSRIEESAAYYLRQAVLNSLQIAFIRWMMFAMFVQGFWYGGSLAREGKLSSGEILRTFWACLTAAQSIEQVLPQMIVLEKGKVASVGLKLAFMEHVSTAFKDEMNGTKYPQHCEGDIEFNNVSFAYPSQPNHYVLQPSTFFFPAGETTFVIGKSGSGKSTLCQLLMQFYLPNSGEILIDGHLIQSLDINWIRNNITLLEQRSVLFNDSILHNIAFGRPDYDAVTRQDVQDSIDLAMLQGTVHELPEGLDTCVGLGGNLLSGGQRQRVAIARARLRDTPILILDEPTSALDSVNRVAVMDSIRRWRKGKTTIIITHDMSQITDHDFVYILENGSIVKNGYKVDIEKQPGSEIYFALNKRIDDGPKASKPEQANSGYCDFDREISLHERLPDVNLMVPKKTHRKARQSWAQHHIPPSFRSNTWYITNKRQSAYQLERDSFAILESRPYSFLNLPKDEVSLDQSKNHHSTFFRETENVQIEDWSMGSKNDPYSMSIISPKVPELKRRSLNRNSEKPKKNEDQQKEVLTPLSHIMGTIWPSLTSKQRAILFLGVVSSLMHASATPIFSYCLSQLLSTFYAGNNGDKLTRTWSLAVLGVSLGDGLASFFMHYSLEYCGDAWINTFRKRAFQRILDQPRAWFEQDGNNSFRLSSYLDQNSEDMRNLLGRFAGFVLVAISITVMAIIWSLIVCWKLTLVALACGPVIYVITRGFEGTNGIWERRCNEANAINSEIFTETFTEIFTVRTLTLEGYFHQKHAKAVARSLKTGLKRAIYTGLLFGMVESTVVFATALIFYYGAILAASEFTVNNVMMVFSLLLFSIGYAAQILSWIPQINTSREIATQLLRLATLPKGKSHEDRGYLKVSSLTPIKMTGLNFRYPSRPDKVVLKGVSVQITRNSCTAIVGRSGSGKSTIASLLLALYETPISHTGPPVLTLGGQNIHVLDVPSLRSQIAIVSQQPTIFPGTIYANISYPLGDQVSLQHVRTAAQAAGIEDFISSLPKGYFTIIGDGGVGLSGGQKQRLVIARALLREPQILILDEATSSLDPAGAEIVRKTIQELVTRRHNLTVIIITHAKEMIEIADHVIVLDQGAVVEDGPYRTLARRVGGRLHELLRDPEESLDA
ncbi:hypothetical protein N7462_008369 [Penicillium macrosclerotiorum]|uniref:uncharacterized protein n=1 Tax=Penicillium macrosclerotiorum TaxID=303699 RepID=UPI002547C24B|nr:uncharacterized protein N7462_008369 [Penicillium macrosclerotiorum]KAJ5675472.1 hypothetical protein N7462_008369 [Penicillium macrosclerotiorum]